MLFATTQSRLFLSDKESIKLTTNALAKWTIDEFFLRWRKTHFLRKSNVRLIKEALSLFNDLSQRNQMKRVHNGKHKTGWLTTAYETNGTKIDGRDQR